LLLYFRCLVKSELLCKAGAKILPLTAFTAGDERSDEIILEYYAFNDYKSQQCLNRELQNAVPPFNH
jgi:hypothetical protein